MVLMQDNQRPSLTVDDIPDILSNHFAITATHIKELTAELDRNFYIKDNRNNEYILKVAHQSLSCDVLDLQNQTLTHLQQHLDFCPTIMPTQIQTDMTEFCTADGQRYIVRVLTYIRGRSLVDIQPHSTILYQDIGSHLGQFSKAMQSFTHTEQRRDYRWNIVNILKVAEFAYDMPEHKRELVDYFISLYRKTVMPKLDNLPHSFIHNDANNHNILIDSSDNKLTFSGLIDFGDMVYAPTIAELAVALSYIMMGQLHPLDSAASLIRAYHAVYPLQENEIKMLFALIGARLCLSVCISWYQQQQDPDNPHLSISENDAWQLLGRLREPHPNFAQYVFRHACGWEPCPQRHIVDKWIQSHQAFPVLDRTLDADNIYVYDLTVGSHELGHVDDFSDTQQLTQQLCGLLDADQIGIGRYNEARPIYAGDMFKVIHHERRTVHIGLDLFADAGTSIHAPYDAIVYSVQDNPADKDYGPTLILEHHPQPDNQFYTLYGHLDSSVLSMWQAGDTVDAGDVIASIGSYPQNGNWPPHLHFQIINDMLSKVGEFPGVALPRYRDVWTSISPNPAQLLGLSPNHVASSNLELEEMIRLRQQHLNPSMSISYQHPLYIVRGYMQYLYDGDGQAYLDCVNNVSHVGHSHPRVVSVARNQLSVLNTNTRYLHPTIIEYAKRLCDTLPDSLNVCFFVNSGSEANELALRLAQTYTGGTDVVVLDHAYHGHTSSMIQLSPYKFNGKGGAGRPDHVQIATLPDGYRGEYRGYTKEVGQRYAESIEQSINNIHVRGKRISAFFAESISGCGGQMTYPDGYLKLAYEHSRHAGGVCVADEVQTGFGRVGHHFWAFETQGIVPDIVTMGKPIGNGHPMAVVVTTREIAMAFHNGMEYFNTFGGNPVSCAIGLEVLNVIEDENLQQNAFDVGEYLIAGLRQLSTVSQLIGHVRGYGLFIGVELVRNPETLEPADIETVYIVERLREQGILLSTEGPLHNVLKIKPPIIFQRYHVDIMLSALENILNDTVLEMYRLS